MKKRFNKINYVREVLNYEREYNANNRRDECYPPIVPKLLLAIYLRLGFILGTLGFLAGVILVQILT